MTEIEDPKEAVMHYFCPICGLEISIDIPKKIIRKFEFKEDMGEW